jgi:hypothetical protein
MRILFVIVLIIVMLVAACQSVPPTQIVLVVTATPNELLPTQTPYVVIVTATPLADSASSGTPDGNPTQMPAQSSFTPIPPLNAFPTSSIAPIQVAEQVFEGGRLFWLQPTRQIWAIVEAGPLAGRWYVFDDTFQDGEAELDPSLVPPEGYIQPIRGFGKVWRSNTELREALGWAIAAEIGYVGNYEYHPGGALNERGLYEAGPGYHILTSQTNQPLRFDETTWTWEYIQLDITPTP